MAIEAISAGMASQLAKVASSGAPQRLADVDKVDPSKFTKILEEGLDRANSTLRAADVAVEKMVETQGANIHEAMVALDKADITARLTTKIGQKLIQAYREVSQMQV